jgi:hypothetical protein
VPSRTSTQRAFETLGPAELRRLAGARRDARATAWAAGAGPDGDNAIIDLDATIVRTKADKEDAAPTHKRTYGHHPLVAMCAETGEVLAGMFRAGNAGANCAADHVVVLSAAIEQLPAVWQRGHLTGDEPALAGRKLLVRTDSAGRRTGSRRSAGTATWASRWATGSTAGSVTPCCWCRKKTGNRPAKPTPASVTARRSSRSPGC